MELIKLGQNTCAYNNTFIRSFRLFVRLLVWIELHGFTSFTVHRYFVTALNLNLGIFAFSLFDFAFFSYFILFICLWNVVSSSCFVMCFIARCIYSFRLYERNVSEMSKCGNCLIWQLLNDNKLYCNEYSFLLVYS